MRSIVILTLCVVAVMANLPPPGQRHYDINKAPEYFAKFMQDHNRTYENDADKDIHYAAFVENLKKINKLNKDNQLATFGINKFADYTEQESKNMRGFGVTKRQ